MPIEQRSEWGELFERLGGLEGREVRVGWRDPEAARIALINDRGGSRGDNPPARPVLAPGIAAVADQVRAIQAEAAKAAVAGRSTSSYLPRLGELVEGSVRLAIEGVMPENAPSTIESKGFDDPLRGPSRRRAGGDGDRIWRHLEWWEEPSSA